MNEWMNKILRLKINIHLRFVYWLNPKIWKGKDYYQLKTFLWSSVFCFSHSLACLLSPYALDSLFFGKQCTSHNSGKQCRRLHPNLKCFCSGWSLQPKSLCWSAKQTSQRILSAFSILPPDLECALEITNHR